MLLGVINIDWGIVFYLKKEIGRLLSDVHNFNDKKKLQGQLVFFFTGSLPNALSLILSMEQTLLTRGSVQAAARNTSDWSTSFGSMSSESRYKICKKN
jgi:hypothetical protein